MTSVPAFIKPQAPFFTYAVVDYAPGAREPTLTMEDVVSRSFGSMAQCRCSAWITCLISIEGCSRGKLEQRAGLFFAPLGRVLGPSAGFCQTQEDCNRSHMWLHSSAQPGTVRPCARCRAPGSFSPKNRFKLLEERRGRRKEEKKRNVQSFT